jgi:Na+-translocating ferredoxin:NAD+ oxidoreductase RnfG subunit
VNLSTENFTLFLQSHKPHKVWLILSLLTVSLQTHAKTEIKDFLENTFGEIPKSQRLWLDKKHQEEIKKQFNPSQIKLSYRYWQSASTTAWVLDEIGKERNITTAIVIENNAIKNVEVIVYRESRGRQVQNQRFTQQYKQKTQQSNLSKEIDSISGATLSVNAVNKQVKLALWLNQQLK